MTAILGISAFYHDSAAAIIVYGKIIAAAQEERFTRKKHDSSYPFHSIETYLAFAPSGFKSFCMAIPIWIKEKLFQKQFIFKQLKRHDKNFNEINKIHFSEHHLSHAASAFFPSPFKEAIVLTADGVGEWGTTTVAIGKDNQLEIVKEIHFPHSLGLLYSAFTYYTGFEVNNGEYKLMGLAPYGEPKLKKMGHLNLINHILHIPLV